ncbi:MAG: ATP-grasp domain-containing protein [Beijerinckiaceae bacterium]|nr:ATP-grasp domain-containing protein [Beijerinckiaceae bacterium]
MLEINNPNISPERPPVLLLAAHGLLRTLGMAGIPAIVASSCRNDPAFFSRYCTGRCILPSQDEPSAVAAALLAAGDRLLALLGRRVPLMYADDYFLELACANADRLREKFLLLLNDPEVASGLLKKDRFEALARNLDLPVPRGLTWETLCSFEGAVLAKPRSKFNWHDSPLRAQLFKGHAKALTFENGPAAASHPAAELYRGQLTFQEYVPGDDRQLWSFHGFSDEQGSVIASFAGRKIRTSPPLMGESSFLELVHDEKLTDYGRRIAERIPLKGPFKMDFKTDAQTGKHFLLEVNARFNLWQSLGAANGVNLMQIAYDYLVAGKRPVQQPYRTDTRWISVPLDFQAYRALAARRELSFAGWLSSIVFTRTVHNHLAWNDPAPFVMKCVSWLNRKSLQLLERSKNWLRKWLSTAS